MDKQNDRFEILRRMTVAASKGDNPEKVARDALRQAAELVDLSAAALFLWDDELKPSVAVSYAVTEVSRESLQSLETTMYSQLRRDRDLMSAYMSFGGDRPYHSFTMPLRHGRRVFGAVIGLQDGESSLVTEDLFLEALTATLSLNFAADSAAGENGVNNQDLEREKLAGITETAVTVNHEINSPLTAILGNVQLLLRDAETLDKRLVAKLQTIEKSAERIQKVTRLLMNVRKPKSRQYSEGITMLDLSEDEPSDDTEN
jgi:signal transduction histidine kinase